MLPPLPPSVYQQLGGYEPIAAVVDVFYHRVTTDMARVAALQGEIVSPTSSDRTAP